VTAWSWTPFTRCGKSLRHRLIFAGAQHPLPEAANSALLPGPRASTLISSPTDTAQIATNAAANRGFPFPLPQLYSTFGGIIGNKPEVFADVPVLLATQGHESGRYVNWRLKPVSVTPWAKDAANRSALWDKLASMVD